MAKGYSDSRSGMPDLYQSYPSAALQAAQVGGPKHSVDYFLKIDGIQGESQAHHHEGEIDIEAWWYGVSNASHPQELGGMGSGKARFRDTYFVASCSKASPKLLAACAGGDHIKTAVLACRKQGGPEVQDFLKITMTGVYVSSFQSGGAAMDFDPGVNRGTPGVSGEPCLDSPFLRTSLPVPLEQFSLSYAKIEYEYKEQKPDGSLGGSVKAGYDLKANKSV